MMLKKVLSICVVFIIVLALSGCTDNKKDDDGNKENDTPETKEDISSTDKPFTESSGLVRYMTIEDIQVAIPETVGEYAKYLEQVGTKVELVTNPNNPDNATDLDETLEANDQSSLRAYFKVYMNNTEYHKFGVHYINDRNEDITIAEAKIDRLVLYNDHLADEQQQDDVKLIQSITFTTDYGDIALDNDTTSKYIMSILGAPEQNTDGYLTYSDESGFVYRFNTYNMKAILRDVEITYPK